MFILSEKNRFEVFLGALKLTSPIIVAYIPMGITFGVLFCRTLPYSWAEATLMGTIVYTGAAQFMSIGMLVAKLGVYEIAIATLFLNFRHLFYGLSMINRYRDTGAFRPYLAFALTDETYSLITTTETISKESDRTMVYFWISFLNHVAWVLGCALGAFLEQFIHMDVKGLEFVLTALFSVAAIEQFRQIKSKLPFMIAAVVGVLSLLLFGPKKMFLVSLTIATLLLLAFRNYLEKSK